MCKAEDTESSQHSASWCLWIFLHLKHTNFPAFFWSEVSEHKDKLRGHVVNSWRMTCCQWTMVARHRMTVSNTTLSVSLVHLEQLSQRTGRTDLLERWLWAGSCHCSLHATIQLLICCNHHFDSADGQVAEIICAMLTGRLTCLRALWFSLSFCVPCSTVTHPNSQHLLWLNVTCPKCRISTSK